MASKKSAAEAVKFKKGDLVKYEARTHKGTGVFVRYEPSGRGMWIILKRDDNGADLALRESQVKPKAVKTAPVKAPAVEKVAAKAAPTSKAKTERPKSFDKTKPAESTVA